MKKYLRNTKNGAIRASFPAIEDHPRWIPATDEQLAAAGLAEKPAPKKAAKKAAPKAKKAPAPAPASDDVGSLIDGLDG